MKKAILAITMAVMGITTSHAAIFTIGSYDGTGAGLHSSSNAVNICNSTSALIASVSFGASRYNRSLNNGAGLKNTSSSTLSLVSVNGAFAPANDMKSGSPATIPKPGTYGIVLFGAAVLFIRRRHLLA